MTFLLYWSTLRATSVQLSNRGAPSGKQELQCTSNSIVFFPFLSIDGILQWRLLLFRSHNTEENMFTIHQNETQPNDELFVMKQLKRATVDIRFEGVSYAVSQGRRKGENQSRDDQLI